MTPEPHDSEIETDTVAQMSPEERAEFRAAVREGLADADAGRVVSFEKVRRWLLSWGTDHELPPPE
jgi:predicted transcriptional regulator